LLALGAFYSVFDVLLPRGSSESSLPPTVSLFSSEIPVLSVVFQRARVFLCCCLRSIPFFENSATSPFSFTAFLAILCHVIFCGPPLPPIFLFFHRVLPCRLVSFLLFPSRPPLPPHKSPTVQTRSDSYVPLPLMFFQYFLLLIFAERLFFIFEASPLGI